jgi:hypothetical protein
MPYTVKELETVDFYQDFIQELRTKYLDNMEDLFEVGFKKGGVLYSFEDILTGLGIEDADVENSLYKFLYKKDFSGYTTAEKIAAKNDPDIELVPTSIKDGREKQFTLSTSYQRKYIKTSNLEKIIDRSISELSESLFAETLPEGILNGDVVTNNITADNRKWLIENNQKRIFTDMATFYGNGGSYGQLKTLTNRQLNTIPDGEPVD